MDHYSVRIFVEHVDCGDWFRMAGRLRANSIRGWTGFLHAGVAWQDSSEVCHSLCGADRPRLRVLDPGHCSIFWRQAACRNRFSPCSRSRWCLQLIPFLYMFAALLKIAFAKDFVRGHYGKGTLIFAGISGFMTTVLGHRSGIFPGAADQIGRTL